MLPHVRIIAGGLQLKEKRKRKEPKKTWKFDFEFHLKAIHKLFLQMWYAVLLPELYYRNLWASVTARVWGKLQHYVPGENEILLSSCTLEALLSQTVQLIKSSQFGVEVLSQFLFPKNNAQVHLRKPKMFHFKSNIVGFPRKLLSTPRDSCSSTANFFDAFTARGLFVWPRCRTFAAIADS